MQKKKNDFQHLGNCRRLFNFIMNSLFGRGMKRVTLGHPMPEGSTNQGPQDAYARDGVQEPLTIHACTPNGEERINSRLMDESDSVVQIQFKKTEELDYWTPVDKLGSSVYLAAKDDKAMEKRTEFTEPSRNKEIPLLNGISVKGKTGVLIQGEGSTGPKISIPITNSADKVEKKKTEGNKFPSSHLAAPKQLNASRAKLTGLGSNINDISETFIRNTKERLSRNVSLTEAEES